MNQLFTALTAVVLISTTAAAAQSSMSMMHTGAFHALGAPTSGTASVTEANGKVTVKLTNLTTEPGPGLEVWLYAAAAPVKDTRDTEIAKGKYVKVGELKRFNGTFSFTAPAGLKTSQYKSVVLWCAAVNTAFGAADLK